MQLPAKFQWARAAAERVEFRSMKSFNCQNCGQLIFFENAQCLRCQSVLGFLPQQLTMSSFSTAGKDLFESDCGGVYRLCRNGRDWQTCNWMVPAGGASEYCLACDLNETIPDLDIPTNREYWFKLEQGKRRLVYSLLRLGLPVAGKRESEKKGLAFQFLQQPEYAADGGEHVTTGHREGLITLNIAEADDLERERTRLHLNEMYRSVLGHFRHESGHYYWWRLIEDSTWLQRFRKLFGDERADYGASINSYYAQGPQPGWQDSYVSAYASSHPWEDWAESWAHYLTIVDALETAQDFGVELSRGGSMQLFALEDSYDAANVDDLLEHWLPLTYAINSINRSAGQSDLYPFVLPRPAIEKLRFLHRVIRAHRG